MLLNRHKKQVAVLSESNLNAIKNLLYYISNPGTFLVKSKSTYWTLPSNHCSEFSVTYSTVMQPLSKIRNPSINSDSFFSLTAIHPIHSRAKFSILYYFLNTSHLYILSIFPLSQPWFSTFSYLTH